VNRLLVGGAVRDRLLGLSPKDHDWLVLGVSPEGLTRLGFRPVGRAFTIFLAPDSHDEHALPRSVPGGTSGDDEADLLVDLERRDLTINAMAMRANGELVDPFGGQNDIANRTIRHVHDDFFAQDPIRILRAARFAARLGFDVAPSTAALMRRLCGNGALAECAPERIYAEISTGLRTLRPRRFIEAMRSSGALAIIAPEIEALFGVPQPAVHHPEVDTGEHVLLCLESAHRLGANEAVRFGVLVHDVGKGLTPKAEWPRHVGHEQSGLPLVNNIAQRWRVPTEHLELARVITGQHLRCHRSLEARPGTVYKILSNARAFSNASLLPDFLKGCKADAQGRLGSEHAPYLQSKWLNAAANAAAKIEARQFVAKGYVGEQIGNAIRDARLMAIANARREFRAALPEQEQ
jgi:tRNA nucleotidyltransferase (CCA-adding enzyme)